MIVEPQSTAHLHMLAIIELVHEAILAAGPSGVSSGQLYERTCMEHISLGTYQLAIAVLVRAEQIASIDGILRGIA